jgi:hypothetical protein
MSDIERWRCKCGAILRVTPDADPKLIWKTLRCKEAPVTSWDYSNEKWWHYHSSDWAGTAKGFVPATKLVNSDRG